MSASEGSGGASGSFLLYFMLGERENDVLCCPVVLCLLGQFLKMMHGSTLTRVGLFLDLFLLKSEMVTVGRFFSEQGNMVKCYL